LANQRDRRPAAGAGAGPWRVNPITYREEHGGEADGAGELPPGEVPLEGKRDGQRLDAGERALERRVEELGRVLQQQRPLLHCPERPYHDRRCHQEDPQRPLPVGMVGGRRAHVVLEELVVVHRLELGALVQRQHDDAGDAEEDTGGFGHAMDAPQLQGLHPVHRPNENC